MKKIFSTMLIAATLFTISCDKDDNDDDNESPYGTKYVGTLSTTYESPSPMAPTITFDDQEDIVFYFKEDDDLGTLTMPAITFTGTTFTVTPFMSEAMTINGMPSLYIVFPDIAENADDTYTADNVTPEMKDGTTYDTNILQSVDNVTITEDDGVLTAKFDCTVLITYSDDNDEEQSVNPTCTVSFKGKEE